MMGLRPVIRVAHLRAWYTTAQDSAFSGLLAASRRRKQIAWHRRGLAFMGSRLPFPSMPVQRLTVGKIVIAFSDLSLAAASAAAAGGQQPSGIRQIVIFFDTTRQSWPVHRAL